MTSYEERLRELGASFTEQAAAIGAEADAALATEPEPEPEPTEPKLTVGSSLHRESGEDHQEAFARRARDWGVSAEAVRIFEEDGPPYWPSFIREETGKSAVPWVSYKLHPSDVLSGVHDAKLAEAFAAAPTNRPTRWAYWHEPEDNTEGTEGGASFTKAQYRDATQRIFGIADAHVPDKDKCRGGIILMGWSVNPSSGRDWRTWLHPEVPYRFVGWDVYPSANEADVMKKTKWCTDATAQLAADLGQKVSAVIMETGPHGDSKTEKEKVDLVHLGCAAARELGIPTWLYFDSTVGGDFRLNTPACHDAIAEEIRKP